MSKNIEDLRAALFETLEHVKAGTMDIDRARAVNELGKTLIESARVEVDFMKTTGESESKFLAIAADSSGGAPASNGLPPGITGIRRHRIR